MICGTLRVRSTYETQLHLIRLCKDCLCSPSRKLAAIILHLSCNNCTTLRRQLCSPVESAAATLGLVIEFVESFDSEILIFAGNVVLDDSVKLGPDDEVERLIIF